MAAGDYSKRLAAALVILAASGCGTIHRAGIALSSFGGIITGAAEDGQSVIDTFKASEEDPFAEGAPAPEPAPEGTPPSGPPPTGAP